MTQEINADGLDLTALLRPGDHIVCGQACGEPTTLIEALGRQAPSLKGISAFTASSFSGLFTPDLAEHITLSSMGAISVLGSVTKVGRLGIVPCHVGQIGRMIEEGLIACDVAFLQVSPPDADGNHSYGLIADHVQQMVDRARFVIAEVNEQVPFTLADATLPHDRIDVAVSVSRPPIEVATATLSDSDRKIAKHAAAFIEDGAVLQIGIGAVPDALLQLLTDRRDLGVHSGMIGNGVVDLVEAGVITNARKNRDRGVSIAGALIGSRRLYDFAHRNSAIGLRGSAYTHSEVVLSSIAKLVTINSALEADLTGQVNAEQASGRYIGGTGGQVDYVRAGSRSGGGRSIIALPSTAAKGTVSRIVPVLGGPVTTARSEVDVIVTEFGAAELKGQTLAERARRMIAISHPEHRSALEEAAFIIGKRGY